MNAKAYARLWPGAEGCVTVGLPVITLIAIVVTVWIAGGHRADESVGDVRRIAQIQIEDLAADRRAGQLGLMATLAVDAGSGAIQVTLASAAPFRKQSLLLRLEHPIDASRDRSITLLPTSDGWAGHTESWTNHAWRVRLGATDGSWLLRGRLAADQQRLSLAPPPVATGG